MIDAFQYPPKTNVEPERDLIVWTTLTGTLSRLLIRRAQVAMEGRRSGSSNQVDTPPPHSEPRWTHSGSDPFI